MNCKPEDWKKCKKIFLIIVATIIVVMISLVLASVILDKKVPESVPQNITQNGDIEFTGPEYKPSKVYDDSNNEISLEKLAEKPMALVFFNTSNEKSLEALEIFAKYEESYSEKLNIVGICISDGITENVDTIQKTLTSNEIIGGKLLAGNVCRIFRNILPDDGCNGCGS